MFDAVFFFSVLFKVLFQSVAQIVNFLLSSLPEVPQQFVPWQ